MAKYRKIDPRIWNDAKFRSLTDDGKLFFLFLLTHPQMTALGAMRASVATLSDELEWLPERLSVTLSEAFSKGMIKHDPKARFLSLPNWLKYNKPENPNVVKAWVNAVDLIPECDLKVQLWQDVKAFVEGYSEAFGKAFAEAFPEPFATPLANQEQEQEQEQKQDKHFMSGKDPRKSQEGESLDLLPPEEPKRKALQPDQNGTPKQQAMFLLNFLNEKTGRNYQPVDANLKLILARLKEFDERTVRQVIANRCMEWMHDDTMSEYLRPSTLFNATKFAQYAGLLDQQQPPGAAAHG